VEAFWPDDVRGLATLPALTNGEIHDVQFSTVPESAVGSQETWLEATVTQVGPEIS